MHNTQDSGLATISKYGVAVSVTGSLQVVMDVKLELLMFMIYCIQKHPNVNSKTCLGCLTPTYIFQMYRFSKCTEENRDS